MLNKQGCTTLHKLTSDEEGNCHSNKDDGHDDEEEGRVEGPAKLVPHQQPHYPSQHCTYQCPPSQCCPVGERGEGIWNL